MRVLYVSNFLNFHQSFLWDSIFGKEDLEFAFLSTQSENDPIKEQLSRQYVFFSNDFDNNDLNNFVCSFDAVILGHCKDKRIFSCLKKLPEKTLVFHNSEHYWKKTNTLLSFCKRILRMIQLKKRYRRLNNLYLLSNSSRLKKEFDFWKIPYKKCFRFGYFPNVNTDIECISQKENNKIIFVGRLIKWKKPFTSINVLNYLSDNGRKYSLHFYGDGEESKKIQKYIKDRKSNYENIFLNGLKKHEEIIKEFNSSDIFVFSSNKEEGWGAVLNEALASSCIVFASCAAGSSNYLIRDGYNGFLYKNKSELYKKLNLFISLSQSDILEIRNNAFLTISSKWNYSIASERLYVILKQMLSKNPQIEMFLDGPMSIQED